MSVDTHDEPPIPSPETLLTEAIRKFDDTSHDFLKACRNYKHFPLTKKLKDIEVTAAGTTQPWVDLVTTIVEDDTIENLDKAQMLAGLIEENDRQRVTYFEKLLDKEGSFARTTAQETVVGFLLDELTDANYEPRRFIQTRKNYYCHNVDVDVNKLLEGVKESPQARSIKIGASLGEHALDIAKLNAGVWIGIKLSRRNQ